ncbi:MAG: DUF1697 domain-containing protein [Acidiferrobacterales bacterium]|nr:DUF1697 domain-containing protein [Acidiferrobacterales bacterium]
MKTYVLLLKGINVGGNNKLPMKELVDILTRRGFEEIKTYIQSGNVILNSRKKPGSAVISDIADRFGFSPDMVVLDQEEFSASVRRNPFPDAVGKEVHFFYTAARPRINQVKIDRLISPTEVYAVKKNVFYLYAPDGIGRSKLAANVDSCVGGSVTGRNLNTIRRLAQLLEER